MPRLPSPAARRDAMNEPDQHSSPIKTPKQLVIVVVLAFVVPIALIILITQLVTGRAHGTGDDASILSRIAPFGVVKIAAPSGPKGNLTGEQVYGQVCKTCHEGGIAGAHKLGDKAAWGKVIAQGEKLTVQHAIAGIRAMPPRSGWPMSISAMPKRRSCSAAAAAGSSGTFATSNSSGSSVVASSRPRPSTSPSSTTSTCRGWGRGAAGARFIRQA